MVRNNSVIYANPRSSYPRTPPITPAALQRAARQAQIAANRMRRASVVSSSSSNSQLSALLRLMSQDRSRTRTRTIKKKGYSSGGGTPGNGVAWKKKRRLKPLNSRPRVGKKFRKKVEKVLDYNKPYGEYVHISDQRLWQNVRDTWNIIDSDNNQYPFVNFTPQQFWNGASILWNEKTPTKDESGSTQGASNNIRYKQPLHVINSYTVFEFKSTSSHVINIQMYICTPKGNTVVDYPSTMAYDSKNAVNSHFYYQDNAGVVQNIAADFLHEEGLSTSWWSLLYKDYKVECVRLKFQPGEYRKHFVQGPKNFTIDGSKHVNDNGTALNAVARFSKTVFFRIINDPTVCGIGEGAETNAISRWPSNTQGGVAMRQKRCYRLRLPDNTDIVTAISHLGDDRQNTLVVGRFTKNSNHDVDQQVTVMNPIDLAGDEL